MYKRRHGKKNLTEIGIKHDKLCARAWEREWEMPTVDNNHHNAAVPISPETAVQSDLAANETGTIPGTKPENSPETFP